MTNKLKTRTPQFILAAGLFVSACAPIDKPVPPSRENPSTTRQSTSLTNAELTSSATRIANSFNSFPKDDSGGIRLIGARSEGQTVIIENHIARIRTRVEPSRARRQLQALVCKNGTYRTFVQKGGTMQFVYSYISNNKGGNDVLVTISKC